MILADGGTNAARQSGLFQARVPQQTAYMNGEQPFEIPVRDECRIALDKTRDRIKNIERKALRRLPHVPSQP
jgi:hypothetical protein